jgi:hypothetical protein
MFLPYDSYYCLKSLSKQTSNLGKHSVSNTSELELGDDNVGLAAALKYAVDRVNPNPKVQSMNMTSRKCCTGIFSSDRKLLNASRLKFSSVQNRGLLSLSPKFWYAHHERCNGSNPASPILCGYVCVLDVRQILAFLNSSVYDIQLQVPIPDTM